MDALQGKHIAVIGSGISGLSSAWLLQKNGARVTLYESDPTCGGHTLTDDTSGFPVDLGFQVFNLTTYPHMVGFLESLGVDSEPSDMSFALSVDGGRLEWGSHSLDSVFAQRSNALSPKFLFMLRDVLRFGREAPKVLDSSATVRYSGVTLGEYLVEHRYSKGFVDNYILPMCAAVWSVPASQVVAFPITMLVRFWVNHHLLDVLQRPCWRVVKGRSRQYVHAVLADLSDVRISTPVASVRSLGPEGPVEVHASDGEATYDAVVMATHSDITLHLLGEEHAPAGMRDILSGIPYADNDIWLHADPSLMPKNKKTWASWNCISDSSGADAMERPVCVTYWINHLQDLPPEAPDLFVTLNPVHEPASDKVLRRLTLSHPVFGEASVAAQAKLPSVQGVGGVYLAGAWCGYGFHEDGIKSAIATVEALGGRIPWTPRPCSPKVSLLDSAAMKLFRTFADTAIKKGRLRIVLPNGQEMCFGTPESIAPHGAPMKDRWRGKPPLDATVRLYNTAFFRKVITRHDTGLGESYMDGDFEVIPGLGGSGGDLGSLLAVATANAGEIEGSRGILGIFNNVGDKALALAHRARSNTAAGSRRNIEEHYDAGNAMYKLFLDDTMTYSCGIWADGRAESLQASQFNKIDALINKAGIREDHHVLEIGCGWGSFAIRAASRTGCRVTGLTLSKEQLAEASARVKAAGLQDRITLLFCDYRDTPDLGAYDCVVSCEMIEAVGHEHLPAFFTIIGAALKSGGRAALQVIAEPDDRYEAYCSSSDFIREHIFPGGHLPSVGACVEAARGTGLALHGCEDIGPDYAVTLRKWREAWEARKDDVLSLGYSERFWRKYRFYFAYCEAGFDARYIHTFQMTWVKDRESSLDNEAIRQRLELSKSGGGGGDGGVMMASRPAPPTASETIRPRASDALTQVLTSLYFFLAGAAVSTSAILWLLPLATFLSAAVYALSALASRTLLQPYRSLGPDRAALWNLNAVHLVYSCLAAFYAVGYVAGNPSALQLSAPQPPATLPRALTAASSGFFGFVLWTEVGARLYKRSYSAVVHYTVLLVLFCAAAHKSVNTPFLSVTLVAEINSVFRLVRRQAGLLGMPAGCAMARVLTSADNATFIACRLVPHAALGFLVACNPQAFAATGTYWLATAGMAYMNAVNVKYALTHFNKGNSQKEHEA